MDAQSLAAFYQLQLHPEGGYYKETYRSALTLPAGNLPAGFSGERNVSTGIYFLLEQGNFSAFHRIKSDEMWHFYAGQTLHVYVIHPEGWLEIIKLGSNIMNGEQFQAVVPANCWFASIPAPTTAFSLVGCTVAPGFDFHDFELANADTLANEFPQHTALIHQLCRQ